MRDFIQIIQLLTPYWRYIAKAVLVGIILTLLNIPGPYTTKLLIDKVYPSKDISLLYFVLSLGIGFSLLAGLMHALSAHFRQYVSVQMGFDFQSRFYNHIQGLDFSFFDSCETGEILARFGDLKTAVMKTIGIINGLIMSALQLMIFPIVLLYMDWYLAVISMLVLPLDGLLVAISKRHYRRLSQELAERTADLSAKTYEALASIRTVQALGVEAAFFRRRQVLFTKVAEVQIKSSRLENGTGFIGKILKIIGSFAYGWYGWNQVLSDQLSLGSFIAFSAYVGYLYGPIERLIGLWPQLEVTLVHARRFLEIYNQRPAIRDRVDGIALKRLIGDIHFHGVYFSYSTDNLVLKGIELTIAAQSTVALVGRSGSGKSTLAKMIPRFYDPTQGCIEIDGRDIRSLQLKGLRQHIGYAMQGSTMFQGSILENLSYGRDIPLADIEAAAQAAYIHDFIVSLPNGYQSEIGEQGIGLSEGQKQRLALARVFLQDTPILILDEPTAALDMESELYIHQALKTIQEGRTTIIIAHRLSTIQRADKIIVLDQGCIVEQGTHEELLNKQGLYMRLNIISARL